MDRQCQSGDAAERRDGRHGQAGRRDFLKAAAAIPAAMAAGKVLPSVPPSAAAADAAGAGQPRNAKEKEKVVTDKAKDPVGQPKLPQLQLGPHTLSRLICGSNCFGAGSHLSVFVNHEMRSYYTPEQILKTLRRCQEVGITGWQSGPGNADLYRRLREEGTPLRYLAIASSGEAESIRQLSAVGCIGIAHHGETTDQLFKRGKLDEAQDYLKRVRDAGMLAGVSTHMPAVVDYVESKGWEIDYYMTCVYERHRSAAELKALLGQVPIPSGEVYLQEDPPRMYKAMRQTKRPCLAFKILAAGRLSERKEWVEQAFRQTLESIKPSDGVIVGIYDKFSDQPAECAELVRRFGATATKA